MALALVATPLVLASCSEIKEPEVTMTGVDFKGISTDGIALDLTLEVENTNTFGADLGELSYTIYLDDTKVATGLRDERVSVPANATVEVDVPFTIVWKGIDRGLKRLLDGQRHSWRFKGRVELSKGPMTRSFRFSERGEFTAPEAGDIEIDVDM
jgi:LEA14-like dessication related protein